MLKIRLARTGKKNQPAFRVVVQEHSRPPQGKFVEKVGFYNPRLKEKSFNEKRINYWLNQGAQPSCTVHNLLVDEGVIEGSKVKATVGHKVKKKDEEEEKKEDQEEKTETEKEAGKESKEAEKQKKTEGQDDDENDNDSGKSKDEEK